MKNEFKIKGKLKGTFWIGPCGDKADFIISFVCGHYIDANVKTYKDSSCSGQIFRIAISKFCEHFGLPEKDRLDLERIMQKKAKNKEKELFTEKDWVKWGTFFKNNVKELLKLAFSKNPSREILVLGNLCNKTLLVKIYAMKDVLRELSKQKIERTETGFKGKNISFQKKGGDRNVKTHPETDRRHPSNNIQMKLNIGKNEDFLNNIILAEYKTRM